MRTLAEQIVAEDPTKLPEGETEVTQENYFRIVSDLHLGQEQVNQFQTNGEAGQIWYSAYQDSGSNTRSDARLENTEGTSVTIDGVTIRVVNNANAEMPRSYHLQNNTIGIFYNWYAAVAESGGYISSGTADDSVCPKGWSLAKGDTSNGSWANLLVNAYGLNDGSKTAWKTLRAYPLLAPSVSGVGADSSIWINSSDARYISSTGLGTQVISGIFFSSGGFASRYTLQKPSGYPTRCVKK